MKAQQLSREARLRRALERWENEGGRIASKANRTPAPTHGRSMSPIHTKHACKAPGPRDGKRFLVDGLWPRGVKKDTLCLEGWIKESAPSKSLREWFAHEPSKWREFQRRYFAELKRKPESWHSLLNVARHGTLTLVFGARDSEHNNAAALKRFLDERLSGIS